MQSYGPYPDDAYHHHHHCPHHWQTPRSLLTASCHPSLAVWLSGNALASINIVVLRQTRLVPGRATACERVNHVGM